MRIIHCTQKLLKEIGNTSLIDILTDTGGLGNIRILETNRDMNKTLRTMLEGRKYFYPVEALRDVLSRVPQRFPSLKIFQV